MSPRLATAAAALVSPATAAWLVCGFCKDGHHKYCPRAVKNGEARIWPCGCTDPDCRGGSILRCLTCKNETPGEISPAMWECLDPEACQVRVNKRLANNPAYQAIKESNRMPTAAKKAVAKAATKPKAEPRDCGCGCDEQTGGGLFRPGHDARLVSTKVKEVGEGRFTVAAKKAALKEFRDIGASEKLVAKFERSVGLAELTAKSEKVGVRAPRKTAEKKSASGKVAKEPVPTPGPDDGDDDF